MIDGADGACAAGYAPEDQTSGCCQAATKTAAVTTTAAATTTAATTSSSGQASGDKYSCPNKQPDKKVAGLGYHCTDPEWDPDKEVNDQAQCETAGYEWELLTCGLVHLSFEQRWNTPELDSTKGIYMQNCCGVAQAPSGPPGASSSTKSGVVSNIMLALLIFWGNLCETCECMKQ